MFQLMPLFIYTSVDHSYGNWGAWGACGGVCGGGAGQQARQQSCIPEQNGGVPCPADTNVETQDCTNNNVCSGINEAQP